MQTIGNHVKVSDWPLKLKQNQEREAEEIEEFAMKHFYKIGLWWYSLEHMVDADEDGDVVSSIELHSNHKNLEYLFLLWIWRTSRIDE